MFIKIVVDGVIKEVHRASNSGLIDSGYKHYKAGKHTAFGEVPKSVKILPASTEEFLEYSYN